MWLDVIFLASYATDFISSSQVSDCVRSNVRARDSTQPQPRRVGDDALALADDVFVCVMKTGI